MKKILFFSLFISFKMVGQSITITPGNYNSKTVEIKKTGQGFEHLSDNGLVGIGTWVNQNFAYIRTISNNNLSFATNSGGPQMTLTTSGRIGIGFNHIPTAQLDVARGTASDGTAIFRGTEHVSHFNYATNEDTYIRGGKDGANVYINDVLGLGNVGIGTITPQAKLHISKGDLRIDALAGNGNVQLYANNQGTIQATLPIAFSAKCESYPSISNNTETTVPFDGEDFDEGGWFNLSTDEFNAPVNGIYHFDAAVIFGNVTSVASGATCDMKIVVGGTTMGITVQPMVISYFQSLNLSQDIKLNAGQKVKITVRQNSGSSKVLSGFTGACLFSGHLVTRL